MITENTICPVCGEHHFEFPDDYDICPICGWENDGVQRDDKDYWGGANSLSVNEAKTVFFLMQNTATKDKVQQIIDNFEQRNNEISNQYKDIDYRTADGEKCFQAFSLAHKDFVTELEKLAAAHRQ